MARIRRTPVRQTVTARTARNRAKRAEALAADIAARALIAKRRAEAPETLGQARVWTRKCNRYTIAGLCAGCAAQAAYGHAQGFADIRPPCKACQPLVSAFPHSGPKGSPWKKILDKLEYMSEAELGAWLDARSN